MHQIRTGHFAAHRFSGNQQVYERADPREQQRPPKCRRHGKHPQQIRPRQRVESRAQQEREESQGVDHRIDEQQNRRELAEPHEKIGVDEKHEQPEQQKRKALAQDRTSLNVHRRPHQQCIEQDAQLRFIFFATKVDSQEKTEGSHQRTRERCLQPHQSWPWPRRRETHPCPGSAPGSGRKTGTKRIRHRSSKL